jgi:anti-sigma B factor antagonist
MRRQPGRGIMSYYLTERGAAGDETTIVLGGELDMRAAPALRDALTRAIERRVKDLIVDLTDATFVDSTAIGALMQASARVREAGGRLGLICTNRNVLRTVEIAGLDRHLAMVPTRAEALQGADTSAAGSKGVRLLNVVEGA